MVRYIYIMNWSPIISVAVNFILLGVFAYSLIFPPSMVEKFARIKEPNLSEAGVKYTRVVTWIWCGFFMVNGSVALYTALIAGIEVWTLYNGLVSYLLIGTLIVSEYLFRQFYLRRT